MSSYDPNQAWSQEQAGQQPAGQPYGQPTEVPSYAQQPYGEQAAQSQGAPYAQAQYAQGGNGAPKSMAVAALLAFFLGVFGAHNFYLGYKGKAIAQLLITVLSIGILSFVTAIWALIEFVLILMRSGSYATDAQGVPLAS